VKRRRLLAALAAIAIAALPGCDRFGGPPKPAFHAIDVSGAAMGGDLRLTDHHGKPRSLADFRGKAVIVFFGFTHCPDVCPTALADAAAAVRELGSEGDRVQVLFVTVDPQRDTPELLRQYVPAFHPGFLGLYGDEAALDRVKKDFKVYSAVREGKTPETYTVDHTSQMFVFDPQGRIRLVVPPGTKTRDLAADLRALLASAA